MAIAVRHRGELAPQVDTLPGMFVVQEDSAARMAELQGRPVAVMEARFREGHRAYVAHIYGEPAAWGWVATASATIGELAAAFTVPAGERYLWNFVTLPGFRGKGIYPRLLEAIVEAESERAERFWIAYAPENHASAAGIRKAGFTLLAELSFDAAGVPVVKDAAPGGAEEASHLLGLPVGVGAVTPCWKCVRAGKGAEMSCAAGECACDYQVVELGCSSH